MVDYSEENTTNPLGCISLIYSDSLYWDTTDSFAMLNRDILFLEFGFTLERLSLQSIIKNISKTVNYNTTTIEIIYSFTCGGECINL